MRDGTASYFLGFPDPRFRLFQIVYIGDEITFVLGRSDSYPKWGAHTGCPMYLPSGRS